MSQVSPSALKALDQKQAQAPSQPLRASLTYEQDTAPKQQSSKKTENCVTKFAFATKTGFSPSNPYKQNQDSFLALPHVAEYRRTHFFLVADGHGQNGKEVSEYIKKTLAREVEVDIKKVFDLAKQQQRVVDSTEVKQMLMQAFLTGNSKLKAESKIDVMFSGSTCVSTLIVGNKIFCANTGDSRAVLAREVDGSKLFEHRVTGLPAKPRPQGRRT